MQRLVLTGVLCLLSFNILAEKHSAPGEWVWIPDTLSNSTEPPMWDALHQSPPKPLVTIDTITLSAPSKLEEVRAWNKGGFGPPKNGISHQMPSNVHVLFSPTTASVQSTTKLVKKNQLGKIRQMADGGVLWSSSVMVENSYRLRLHLNVVDLPKNVKMWVYGDTGEFVGPFGRELIDDQGNLWTPSVAGPSLKLVALVPDQGSEVQFTISSVMELFKLDSNGQPQLNGIEASDLSCLKDAQCFTSETYQWIAETKRAVAHIHFIKDDASFICSGGLINDKIKDTYVPYFLTANHCISTQATASSLEAYWDFKSTTCDGLAPSHGSVPRTNGATLLTTGKVGDFTLLELNSVPSGRWFLGWQTGQSVIEPGTVLHNISHPQGMVAQYSQTVIDDGTYWCAGWPRDSFIYKLQTIAGTAGGSSGAPTLLDSGQVVGQFIGWCGENQENRCDYSNLIVDGALNAYYSSIAQYINEETSNPVDLALTIFDAVDGTYTPEDKLVVEVKTENVGGTASDSFRLKVYASTNTTISSTDYDIGYFDYDALGVGESSHYNITWSTPFESIPDGNYYIGGILDINDADNSNNSKYDPTPITVAAVSGIVPDAPTLTTVDPGDGKAVLHFTANGNGGSAITSFTAKCAAFSQAGASSPITVSGLRNGYTYSCWVVATNAIGDSAPSATLSVTPEADTPPLKVSGSHSGIWYNANQSGHGLNVVVLDENTTVVFWYVYHTDGTPMFLITVGENQGNLTTGTTYYNTGMKFGEFNPNDVQESVWGTSKLTFSDCNTASLEYASNDSAYGSGTIPMERLASVSGLTCSD